jgi:serine/threonine protein kinase/tetratricopeptide (TPR) repeat protein
MADSFRCLTQGRLVDTFLTIDGSGSRQVLEKRPAQFPCVPREEVVALLRESYFRVRALRHPNILAPLGLVESEESLSIIFPFIPQEHLIELNAENFLRLYKILLPQMFEAIDFVHSMGVVHCDLKATNWLIVGDGEAPRVLLTDFDLSTRVGARPDDRLFGTPGHIAPEILRNEIVVPQSDHYSLGIMLRNLAAVESSDSNQSVRGILESGLTTNPLKNDEVRSGFEMFVPMVNELTQLHYHDRPSSLGSLAARHTTILDPGETTSENRLAWQLVKAKYRSQATLRSADGEQIKDFLFQDVRISGIPVELIDDLIAATNLTFRQKVKRLRNWIMTSKISRFGEFLFVQLDESQIKEFYQSVGLIDNGCRDTSEVENRKPFPLRQALRYKVRRQHHKCILLLRMVAASSSSARDGDSRKLLSMVHAKLAETYQRIGKPKDAAAFYQLALRCGGPSVKKRCAMLIRLADLYLLEGGGGTYLGTLSQAYREAKSAGLTSHKAQILTKQLWLRYISGHQSSALSKLMKVEAFAAMNGMHTRRIIATNAIGCIYMSQGELRKARAVFLSGIRRCKTKVGLSSLQALYINLGLVCNDLGLYRSAARHLSSALKNLDLLHDMARQSWAYNNLSATFSLQGRHKEAIELVSKDFTIQSLRADPAGLARSYLNLGWANLRSGKCREAYLNLECARSISSSLGSSWLLGRSSLYLAILANWQGDHGRAAHLLREAQTLIDPNGDRVHSLDGMLLSLQLDIQEEGGRFDLDR